MVYSYAVLNKLPKYDLCSGLSIKREGPLDAVAARRPIRQNKSLKSLFA